MHRVQLQSEDICTVQEQSHIHVRSRLSHPKVLNLISKLYIHTSIDHFSSTSQVVILINQVHKGLLPAHQYLEKGEGELNKCPKIRKRETAKANVLKQQVPKVKRYFVRIPYVLRSLNLLIQHHIRV